MTSRTLPRRISLQLFSCVVITALSGCIVAVIPEQAESRIIITPSSRDCLARVRSAMAEFSAKYNYSVSTPAHYPPGLAQTDYKARLSFLGIGASPHPREQPVYISVFRRGDAAIVISYHGQTDVRTNANPVVNDLKDTLSRHTRGEHIAYTYAPAHLRLTGVGD